LKQLGKGIQLSEKRVQLIQLSSSLNSGLGDLAIRIVNADSHPLVQSLREEAHSAALELDKVVIIITNTIISGHACQAGRAYRIVILWFL
jgi:hypothetical protein